MSINEDSIPLKNPYSWVKEQDEADNPLDKFLAKYRPSMVQNDGTKPWIWATRERGSHSATKEEAIAEGTLALSETIKKVEEIQSDESIPVRANKKKGVRSKKEVREETQAEAAAKLQEIATRLRYTTGKWLSFASGERVDVIWTNLAKSLIYGPLSSTIAFSAKVSTSPLEDTPNYQHVICIYMPNVYDKDEVKTVLEVLLRNHGLNLSGVKADLYTVLGITSKHPSGMPSTVMKATDLMQDTEIKKLKEAFFAELQEKPATSKATDDAKTPAEGPSKTEATKPKLVKKKQTDDPFGSASEDEDEPKKAPVKKAPVKKVPAKKAPAKKVRSDSENESAKETKKKAPTRKRARKTSDSDDDDEPAPTRIKRGAKK